MNAKYKIGYIDEDKSQVKLYKRKLKEYGFEIIGYEIKKGMTLHSLMDQVYLSDIDLLMIDFKLNETNVVPFNGEAVENSIYDNKPLFPHIIFTNKVEQAEPFIEDWKIIFDKDEIFTEDEPERVQRFVNILTKSIEQYRTHIGKKKDLLSGLLEKNEEVGLNAMEKNDLISIQDELKILDKTKINEVPKHLVSIEKLENLSKTRIEAAEFLQTLIDKSKTK